MPRDALILFGPAVPDFSDSEDCKQIAKGLLREHSKLNVDSPDISISHRTECKPNGRDKKNNLCKLRQRNQIGDISRRVKQLNFLFTPIPHFLPWEIKFYKSCF